MAELQPVTDPVSHIHDDNEGLLASKSVVAATTSTCELENDERVGSSSVEVSHDVEVDGKNEAVRQDASYTSVIGGKKIASPRDNSLELQVGWALLCIHCM